MTRRGADILEGAIKRIAAGLSPYGSYVCGSAGFVGFQVRATTRTNPSTAKASDRALE